MPRTIEKNEFINKTKNETYIKTIRLEQLFEWNQFITRKISKFHIWYKLSFIFVLQ